MKNKNICWNCGHKIGLLFVVLFILCFISYFFRPEQELHLKLLSLTFFGFSGMNLSSFIFAVIQAYLAGYVGVIIWWLAGCCSKTGCCLEESSSPKQ